MSSDARRDADRWLLWYAGGEQLTEDGRKNAVRTATLVIRALLASEPAKAPFVSRNEEWGLRPDFTTAGVPAPPAGAEVREAAERVRSLPPSTNEFNVAVANLLTALRATASPARVSDAVREAAERLETWTDPATGDQYAHGRCVGAPASAGIGEAAKIIRRIVTNHDARITERGVLVYGRPCMSTGFVEAIEWLSRYDAALRGGQKGGK